MSEVRPKKRVLSGIQPTGKLHIGNYIGALSVWVQTQSLYENIFCIADLHAITIPEAIEPGELALKTREMAALYLAAGLDPDQSVIFLQSDVWAHPYLAWILGCCTPLGWLERMTQYKSKAANLEVISAGLLTYPVLQAADILLYKPDLVPVGEDQKQHVELARDVAQRFNHLYGDCFPLPAPQIRVSGARIMGLDAPETKMSKSIGAIRRGHAIGLLDSPDVIKKAIMSAVTDTSSETRFDHAGPGVRNLLVLYEALSGESRAAIEDQFEGRGYGTLKKALLELAVSTLKPIQERYHELTADPDYLERLLEDGAERARAIADATVAEVRGLTGLVSSRS